LNDTPLAVQTSTEQAGAPLPGRRWLWLHLLAGPIIYAVYFMAAYLLVEAACTTGLLNFSLAGTNGVTVVVLGLTAAALAVVLASLAVHVVRLRRLPQRSDPETGDPDRFVAQVGVMLDLLFVLLVLATGAPALILAPCAWSG
jgi:hypothetical protein